jgi:hypothetical protein
MAPMIPNPKKIKSFRTEAAFARWGDDRATAPASGRGAEGEVNARRPPFQSGVPRGRKFFVIRAARGTATPAKGWGTA